jgi:hypothetical protein
MGHDSLAYLLESARDMVTYEAWYALGGLVLTGLGFVVAYLRGAGRPVLWFLGGAVASIAALLMVWLILIWSGPKTMAIIGAVTAVGVLASGLARIYRSEKARLQGHPKGLLDFKRDFDAAAKRNLRAMALLTKETQDIGAKTVALATGIQAATTDSARSAAMNKAANTYRRAAARYRRRAMTHQRASSDFTTAAEGILAWLQQAGNAAQLQQQLGAVQSFRNALVTARGSVQTYRNSVNGLPNMSQRMNAAKAELIAAIDISLSTMDAAITFSNGALALSPP